MKKASGRPGRGLCRGVAGLVTGSKWCIESYVMNPTAPPIQCVSMRRGDMKTYLPVKVGTWGSLTYRYASSSFSNAARGSPSTSKPSPVRIVFRGSRADEN